MRSKQTGKTVWDYSNSPEEATSLGGEQASSSSAQPSYPNQPHDGSGQRDEESIAEENVSEQFAGMTMNTYQASTSASTPPFQVTQGASSGFSSTGRGDGITMNTPGC